MPQLKFLASSATGREDDGRPCAPSAPHHRLVGAVPYDPVLLLVLLTGVHALLRRKPALHHDEEREAAIQVGASPLSSVATASCVGVSMVLGLLATLFLDFLRWIGVTSLLLPPWFLGMPIPFLCYPVPWFLGLLGFVVLGSCVNDLIPL